MSAGTARVRRGIHLLRLKIWTDSSALSLMPESLWKGKPKRKEGRWNDQLNRRAVPASLWFPMDFYFFFLFSLEASCFKVALRQLCWITSNTCQRDVTSKSACGAHLGALGVGQLETQVWGLCREVFVWSAPCSAPQVSDVGGKLGDKNPSFHETTDGF